MNNQNYRYSYSGPVMEFDKVIADSWSSSTYAPTESKARSNLIFQFKKQYNKVPNTRISLAGEIKRIG